MATFFKTISKASQKFLDGAEGEDIEFKQDIGACKNEILVSFANSPHGGTILIGVKEITGEKGLQKGEILGCPGTDNSIQQITNKLTDCEPAIKANIYVENTNLNPFIRLQIPTGKHKPYSTKKGEYTIRSDGRTRKLHQDELLAIFLEKEGNKFLGEFRENIALVHSDMNDKITKVNDMLLSTQGLVHSQTSSIEDDISHLSKAIGRSIGDIETELEEASAENNEVQTSISDLSHDIEHLSRDVNEIYQLLREHVRSSDIEEISQSIDRLERGLYSLLETPLLQGNIEVQVSLDSTNEKIDLLTRLVEVIQKRQRIAMQDNKQNGAKK